MNGAASQPAPDMASTAAHHALEALRWDWGDAYEIGFDDDRSWHARRRDGLGGWLTATCPDELYEVIAADYAFKPVPRSVMPGEES